jgi:hypothetical protein
VVNLCVESGSHNFGHDERKIYLVGRCCRWIIGTFAQVNEESLAIFNDWVLAIGRWGKFFNTDRATIAIGKSVRALYLFNGA